MNSENNYIPNGLLSSKEPFVVKVLDKKRWSQAEARAAELLENIQPNHTSEASRNAVVSYIQCVIMKSVPCQVFPLGSVPLKTYLPDGDIDLTVFGYKQHSEDRLIQDVLCILEREEKNERAKFQIKEVQYIQAEVKIMKCLVENFAVDISFNQISGSGTLCFLEEVDNLIKQNHLLKRSIILIKAWCYYESRVLGSQHGLISTYGLETLIIYLFNVYNNIFSEPLEVLFQFLDFFSKFDWSTYCISLKGPIPIRSLPNMKAEPPLRNHKKFLLSEDFLNACECCYGVMLNRQELKEKPFVSKYLNIVDPLRSNNNLGRSISKGNFCRIKSAIALGAKSIKRLLACPVDNIMAEFDLFFKNTWDRNGRGYWMDKLTYNLYMRNNSVTTNHEGDSEQAQAYHERHGIYQNPANLLEESMQMFGTSDILAASQTWSSKNNGILTGKMAFDIEHTNTINNALADSGQSPIYSSDKVHDVNHFTGFYTSSEFAHLYSEAPTDHFYNTGISPENQQSLGKISHDWKNEYAVNPKNTSTGCYYEYGLGVNDENVFPVDEAMQMHPEALGFPPHVLAPGYMHENSVGVLREEVPFIESLSSYNMPSSQDIATFPSEEFSSQRSIFFEEELTEPNDYNVLVPHSDPVPVDIGSSFGNSSCQTDVTSYTPKDHVVTTKQKCCAREKGSGNPPANRIINKDVNSRSSSSSRPTLHSTWRTNPSASNSSSGLSGKTYPPGGVNGNRIDQSTIGSVLRENISTESITSRVRALQLDRKLPMTVPNSSLPDHIPVHSASPGSSQRAIDKQSSLPVAEGSSGPSFQVPSMFPFYKIPTETETTFAATNDVNHTSYDILNGDYARNWLHLQFGRLCKNPKLEEALHPMATLPTHLRSQFAWHRKSKVIMNIMEHVQIPVRVMPSRLASPLHGGTNKRNGFWIPRFSDGTGTFFPKPSSSYCEPRFYKKKRNPQNQNRDMGNLKYENKDNDGEREENSYLNSKERFPDCGQIYGKSEKTGSNESSHRGESSHSGTSEVANFGTGRASKSSSTQQHSSSKNPWI